MNPISRAYPLADLESMHVMAVANGWIVSLGIGHFQRPTTGEQFVFSTPQEMAEWMRKTLPPHAVNHHSV